MALQPIRDDLFLGCCMEANRCNDIHAKLEGLRRVLDPTAPGAGIDYLVATLEAMRTTTAALRELPDLSQVHMGRASIVAEHLNVVLPCLRHTLLLIEGHCDDRGTSRQMRWRQMFHAMKGQADGLLLPQQFAVYNLYLVSLRSLLIRSPDFDFNELDRLQQRIMLMRDEYGLPLPTNLNDTIARAEAHANSWVDRTNHWAQNIFSLPLTSRTELRNGHPSESFGPHHPWGHLKVPHHSTVLFRRSFDSDQIALIVYKSSEDQSVYFLLRRTNVTALNAPWFSVRAVHELRVSRDGSALHFKRRSYSENCTKLWAVLYFMTWEEMILLHCTFISLKARNNFNYRLHEYEYKFTGERRLFQGLIRDDGFDHNLIVYKDHTVGGVRLQASVWDIELRRCPVWTAFVTHQVTSTAWIQHRSRRRVRLIDIKLYVFCEAYRERKQRRGAAQAFEIEFLEEESCEQFKDVIDRLAMGPATPVITVPA